MEEIQTRLRHQQPTAFISATLAAEAVGRWRLALSEGRELCWIHCHEQECHFFLFINYYYSTLWLWTWNCKTEHNSMYHALCCSSCALMKCNDCCFGCRQRQLSPAHLRVFAVIKIVMMIWERTLPHATRSRAIVTYWSVWAGFLLLAEEVKHDRFHGTEKCTQSAISRFMILQILPTPAIQKQMQEISQWFLSRIFPTKR